MIRKLITSVFLIVGSCSCLAYENYWTNYLSPYPPACATNYQVWDQFNNGGVAVVYSEMISLTGDSGTLREVELTLWRKGCAESGRSVLLVDLSPVDDGDGLDEWVFTPWFWASSHWDPNIKLRAIAEPNTSYATDETQKLWEGRSYTLFLENPSTLGDFGYSAISPEDYNDAWKLVVRDVGNPGTRFWEINIPAYANDLQATRMALTGRLSGNWVVDGASDQGFVLAFEELPNSLPWKGLFFLSWYTYDSDGNLLWLTGANNYPLEATEVTVDIELVTGGQFFGPKVADRKIVGSARLIAIDCNALHFEYDLNSLGLGAQSVVLQRLFALEIQGHACRDIQARIGQWDQ